MGTWTTILLLAFCGLQHTTSACNVSCTTDYISSLNCTSPLSSPCIIVAECGNQFDGVTASCETLATRHWCILEWDIDQLGVGADTVCRITGSQVPAQPYTAGTDSSLNISLSDYVKPHPPFNISLVEGKSSFNISWEMAYTETENYYLNNELIYRVCMRTEDEPGKVQCLNVNDNKRSLEIRYSNLEQVGEEYIVYVQAKVRPEWSESGFWSEWSPSIKWKAPMRHKPGDDKEQLTYWKYLWLFTALGLSLCGILLCFWKKLRLKQIHLSSSIPSPESFFKPLYHKYNGDFTKWAGPTFIFGEFDFLEKNMVSLVEIKRAMSKCGKDAETTGRRGSKGNWSLSSSFFSGLPTHSSSKQQLLDVSGSDGDNNDCQATQKSTGHVSINTVMVLGEEGSSLEGLWDSYGGSLVYPAYPSSQDGMEAMGSFVLPGLLGMEWDAGAERPERLSLNSFSSGERSEDGYPHVVLDPDTIDSGFVESGCSSPVNSDFSEKDAIDAAMLSEPQCQHTNYVKQWVATGQETKAEQDS